MPPMRMGLAALGLLAMYRPVNPVADASAAQAATPTAVADGAYRCHKISPGGQLMDIGVLRVSSGQATLQGVPAGWTVSSIAPRSTNARGERMIALDYRSEAGFNDRLDCVAQ